jgi:hypothetical protein
MRRVLAKNGYVFIQVPYMSPLRKIKANFGLYKEFKKCDEEPENFYQFFLNKKTLIKDFKAIGFKLIASGPRVGVVGFMEEVSLFRSQLERLFTYSGRSVLVKGLRYILDAILSTFSGHTIFMVFQKE